MDMPKVLLLLCVASFCYCDVLRNVGIYGGKPIEIERAPYMAQVRVNDKLVCGGTIVHERFVLTAAGCISVVSDKKYHIDVLVGTASKSTGGKLYEVEKYSIHPSYNRNGYKDINACLIKLSTAIEFGNNVKKIELSQNMIDLPYGTLLNVTGWGKTETVYPKELTQTTIPTVDRRTCRDIYKKTNVTITHAMMCAGTDTAGACNGDIGGPLTAKNVQVGIIAYRSEYCQRTPTVFTKIAAVYSWIITEINKLL